MHRVDIVAALHKRGITVKQLSLDAGLAASTLNNALVRPYRKGESIIAVALEMTPADIWPSRYPQ
ncbi:helix-turn-helix domain-containing protein [Vibrio sp. Sgm 5]|uniref:helix-turn-helix domain-containing protein n=1 Tax=Vibrio sp. Sgm 5 TaxID=2994387 RepID=UPI002248B44B|nr:helix-turn-helix transcriptional regulator [Vibrio sp. Sgm 5]MCX2788382.1 helix-turn-helix transcriptional regulator [Vibrio sp. Sgm 5]